MVDLEWAVDRFFTLLFLSSITFFSLFPLFPSSFLSGFLEDLGVSLLLYELVGVCRLGNSKRDLLDE